MTPSPSPLVHLARRTGYEGHGLHTTAAECLDRVLPDGPSEGTVLLKPNFISRQNAFLSCTHPALIEAVCAYFSRKGNRVLVGDSPAFGSAASVAAALGLAERLAPYGAKIVELRRGSPFAGQRGKNPAFARLPEEVELLVNLPKLKAHKQMAVSGATKNLFGLVPGVAKAVAHVRHGGTRGDFAAMLLSLLPGCPPQVSLMDGIRAMQGSGPTDGEPCDCGILAASRDPVALDTAIYLALGLQREDVPLWQAAWDAGLTGADPEKIAYSGYRPDQLRPSFRLPNELKPVSFHPLRLAKSICQRGLARLKPAG